jgi:hypothetical protein
VLFERAAQLNPENSETREMLERLRTLPVEGSGASAAAVNASQ